MSFLKKCNLSYVLVSSVEEYFALPKEKRERFGLYRLPYALPWERCPETSKMGWDEFYCRIKKQYPVQYFFRVWLFGFDNPVCVVYYKYFYWPFLEFKRAFKYWLNPLYPRWRASLPRHKGADISELLVTSNFALIRDFYWEEVVDGIVDWESESEHKIFYDKLIEYVQWIEETLPKLEEDHTKSLSAASSKEGDYYTKYEETIKIEKEKYDKETEILTWCISNRNFFWS